MRAHANAHAQRDKRRWWINRNFILSVWLFARNSRWISRKMGILEKDFFLLTGLIIGVGSPPQFGFFQTSLFFKFPEFRLEIFWRSFLKKKIGWKWFWLFLFLKIAELKKKKVLFSNLKLISFTFFFTLLHLTIKKVQNVINYVII